MFFFMLFLVQVWTRTRTQQSESSGKFKTEAMRKKYVAMVHVVVLSIFNVLIVFVGMCPLLRLCLRAGPKPDSNNPKVRCHDSVTHFVPLPRHLNRRKNLLPQKLQQQPQPSWRRQLRPRAAARVLIEAFTLSVKG
jgi:hypothetical protein